MASAILASAVIAVTWAITAGQVHAFQARQRIVSTLLAEDRVAQLSAMDYSTMGGGFDPEGDVVILTEMTELLEDMPGVDVRVKGKQMTVRVVATDGTVMAEASRFIPEPGP